MKYFILFFLLFKFSGKAQNPNIPSGTPNTLYAEAADVNMAVILKNDTFFVNSGTHFLHEHFGYTTNEDSIRDISDTIYTKTTNVYILDTLDNKHDTIKICKQAVSFYWAKNIAYNPEMISLASVAYKKTTGRWDDCYYYTFYYNQSAVCYVLAICDLPNHDTYNWCSNIKYTKIFEDNFDGVSLNREHWNVGYGWGREVTNSSPAIALDKNVVVSNGTVKLNCIRETSHPVMDSDGHTYNHNFSSGAISTVLKYGYGKYEMRAKIPQISGVNPAYWLNSSELEIDGFEFFNHNRADAPVMTVYSKTNNGMLPQCTSWGYDGKNRVFKQTANKSDQLGGIFPSLATWNTLPNLADGNWWHFSIIYDPNYITWWVEDDNHTKSWSLTFFNVVQQGQANANPNQNCSCTGCNIQVNTNFPRNYGDITFIIDNEWNETRDFTNNSLQQSGPSGTSTMEIDWVKIYVPDDCWNDVTKSSGFFRAVDHGNKNHFTANNITMGGNGPSNPYEIRYAPWGSTAPQDGTPQTDCLVRANDQIALLDGFSVQEQAVFEASISYHLGDNASGVPSDCNLPSQNDYWPQVYRSASASSEPSRNVDAGIKIFPNPGNGLYDLNMAKPDSYYVEVYNILGTKIKSEHFTGSEYRIDLQNEASGVYLFNIRNNTELLENTRIIKN